MTSLAAEACRSARAPDTLWRRAESAYRSEHAVIGIRLCFETNATEVMRAAEAALGAALSSGTVAEVLDGPVTLRVLAHDSDGTEDRGEPGTTVRAAGEYLLISAGASFGFADGARGFATAFLSPRAVASATTPGSLAETAFIECLGVYLASRYRRASLHAAAVAIDGRCILLTGAAGAGKSTLAYACARSGCGFMAEDVVFAQWRGESMVVCGVPWHVHLMPDAVRLFPELASLLPVRRLNGEPKLRVDVRALGSCVPIAAALPVAGVLVVSRSDRRRPRVSTVGPVEVATTLCGFEGDPIVDGAAMSAAAHELAAAPTARLEAGTDVAANVAAVRTWAAAGSRRFSP